MQPILPLPAPLFTHHDFMREDKKVLLRERKRHTARRVVSTPSVVLTGYPPPVLTWWGGTLLGGTLPGGPYLGTPGRVSPPSWPGGYPARGVSPLSWVPPSRVPPILTWQGTPLGVCPMEFWVMLQSIMGYGYPPGVCPMAFWDMLQSIMGYGYPPSTSVCPMVFWEMLQSIMGYGYTPPPVDRQIDGWKDRRVSKHYLPVVLRTRAVIRATSQDPGFCVESSPRGIR